MATTTVPEPRPRDSRSHKLVLSGDRTAEFRRARIRSVAVRALRWGLPALGVVLIIGYAVIVLKTAGWGTSLPEIALRKILPQDLAMSNPHYEGFGKDGSSYTFTAKTARQDLASMNIIALDTIEGWVVQADKTRTDLAAPRGTFDHEAGLLELYDDISVVSESGLRAKLTRATVITKESLIKSSEPVVVEFPSGTIRSNSMTLRQKAREVSFVENVQVTLTPGSADVAGLAKGAEEARSRSSLFVPTKGPINIAATRLDVNDASKVAQFSGEVKAVQGDSTLSTPELEIAYEGSATEKSHAAGDATAPEKTAASIRRIVAKNPVVMTRGDGDVVTSEGAEFDAVAETSVLTGNVVMTTGTDRRATSDRADLDQRADTALLTGRVVIVQGKNELRGERLFIDRKSGQTQLTWPAGQDSGPGRIAARLYRGEPSQPAKSKAAASAPSGGAEVMSFKTDPNAPIEIDADRLDVDDTKKAAVFSGEVNAVQGDFTIRSAELHAFYKGGAGLADVTRLDTPPGGAAKQAANTELTRIVAKKDVVVTSKRGQTATGDWAEYDAKANTVLVGGNVVIAQGQNLVRGTRLVIDMTSGESTIDTAPPKATAEPAGGGWMTQAPAADAAGAPENSGRASAVFFPQQLREKNAARNAPANTPDGWSSSTDLALPAANGN